MPEFVPNQKVSYQVLSPVVFSNNFNVDANGDIFIDFNLFRILDVYFYSTQVSTILSVRTLVNTAEDTSFDGCIINTTDGKSYLCVNVRADDASSSLFPDL